MPERVRLSRAKGWRMPPNTVKVDRSTLFGNPFKVGEDGTADECVALYRHLLAGRVCLTAEASIELQRKSLAVLQDRHSELRGRNLACWCRAGQPCHAEVLLEVVNRVPPHREDPIC